MKKFLKVLLFVFCSLVILGCMAENKNSNSKKHINPFLAYDNQIAELKKSIKDADAGEKAKLEESLKKVEDARAKAVEAKNKSYNDYVAKIEKQMSQTQSKKEKRILQRKMAHAKKYKEKLDKWAAANCKAEKDTSESE